MYMLYLLHKTFSNFIITDIIMKHGCHDCIGKIIEINLKMYIEVTKYPLI